MSDKAPQGRPGTGAIAAAPSRQDGAASVATGTPLRFETHGKVDPDEWQAIADASPHATFFHTPAWFSLFISSDPSTKIATRIYRFEDGKTAVFPLLERRGFGGLSLTAESSPASCYGGLISADPLTPDHVLPVVRDILRKSSNLIWRVNPLDPLGSLLDPFCGFADSTEILNLREFADETALVAHFRHSARKQINKGSRAGLTAWTSEKWEEWEEYYRLYETRLRQWGTTATSHYPIRFFRALYETRGPNLKLWVVAHGGRIAGGNLNFYQGRHCVEWHAAYDSEFFSCGVRDFLVAWIVRDAWARGFTWYDFNPSGGHDGTRRFKQSFGTVAASANLILVRRGIYRLGSARHLLRLARNLRRRCFCRPCL